MTEIARTTPLNDRMMYAKALAEANLLPAAYRKQPANVLLAMEYGDALGLSPIAAIQGVHIIDGKPTASAQLIGALVRKAGHRLRVQVNGDGTAAKATITRSDDPEFEFTSLWTMDRAVAAGLAGKGTWKQYPAAMLKSRAITEVARDACPEVLSGVAYTPEELGHDDDSRPVERVAVPHTSDVDPWQTPPVDGDGVIVDAELVEDRPVDVGTLTGPAARDRARTMAGKATDAQLRRIYNLADKVKADHADLDTLVHAETGVDTVTLLNKQEASKVITVLEQAVTDLTGGAA